jgi:hypothetical protein
MEAVKGTIADLRKQKKELVDTLLELQAGFLQQHATLLKEAHDIMRARPASLACAGSDGLQQLRNRASADALAAAAGRAAARAAPAFADASA